MFSNFALYEGIRDKKCCQFFEILGGVDYIMAPPRMQKGNSKQAETLAKFRSDTNSVLLGTGSYWEGINIEGVSLSNVIIFKLPFPVREPIIDYKVQQSENGLMEIYVPEMIIKLKQGIGRLIRSESDKGDCFYYRFKSWRKIQGAL